MSYLNPEDIEILANASKKYSSILDPEIDNDALQFKDLNSFSMGQFASILRSNYQLDQNPLGLKEKNLTDEEFVEKHVSRKNK